MNGPPNQDPAAIGVDWGTSSFRAMLLSAEGHAIETRRAAAGILRVQDGNFEGVFSSQIGDWLTTYSGVPVVLSGMIGSRQGWIEAPYLDCPADLETIAAAMTTIPMRDGRELSLAPGLTCRDADGVPDVMRGEEVQILGAMKLLGIADATVCLPGTHSKWVNVVDRRVMGFTTHMTGEVFDVVRRHTILAKTLEIPTQEEAWDDAAFLDGVGRSGATGGLLHHLFGVRTSGLFGELTSQTANAYLSGLLIGHELGEALRDGVEGPVFLIGDPRLVRLYRSALEQLGTQAELAPQQATSAGLFHLACGG